VPPVLHKPAAALQHFVNSSTQNPLSPDRYSSGNDCLAGLLAYQCCNCCGTQLLLLLVCPVYGRHQRVHRRSAKWCCGMQWADSGVGHLCKLCWQLQLSQL